MTDKLIKCSKCRKGIFYIPEGYTMGIKITCISCKKSKSTKTKTTRRTASANYAKIKKGRRLDVHPTYSFKSPTEANFARIMNFLNLEWKYEERAFSFDGYKRKPHVYIMDFEIIGQKAPPPSGFEHHNLENGYYEIKGYMTPQSREKLRRLKRHYQEEFKRTRVVIYNKYKKQDIEFCDKVGYQHMFYDELTKIFQPLIPEWE